MEHWNQKVAANRGKAWKEKLLAGRFEAARNPTTIRLARVKKLLSQTEVAKTLEMTYATYGAIESGRRPVKEDRAKRIAQLLGVGLKSAFTSLGEGKFLAKKA